LWNVAIDACHVYYTSKTRSWVEMASSTQAEKEAFFRRLDELDELALENDGEVTDDTTLKAQHHSHNLTQHQSRADVGDREPSNSHTRTPPAPWTKGVISSGPLSKETMPAKISKRRSVSKKMAPKLSKKPISEKSFQLQPEDAQIFRGLTFCEIYPVAISASGL
jgi:hypothetical protein